MNKLTIMFALLSGVAAVPATAWAMEPYLPRSAGSFDRLDADKDGRVTSREIMPKAEARFFRMDADNNGEVSAAEIDAALAKAIERRCDRVLAALDPDKSGAVSKAELDQFVDALVKGADGDGDGAVTFEEARKFRVAKARKPATGEGEN